MRTALNRCMSSALAVLVFAGPTLGSSEIFQREGGTLSAASVPVMSNGKLIGCQLSFDAIALDHTYRQGALIKVSGSSGMMATSNGMGVTVKVVVSAFDGDGVTLKPSPPSRAYLVGKDLRNNFDSLVDAAPSDQPGGWFAIYQASPAMEIVAEAIEQGELTFAFNQLNGSSDIQLNVDLAVESTNDAFEQVRSRKTIEDYAQCISTLATSGALQ